MLRIFSKKNKAFSIFALVFVAIILITSISVSDVFARSTEKKQQNVYNGKAPKYVFLFIGDGMSYPQVSSAEMYLGKKAKLKDLVDGGGIVPLSFSEFPTAGTAQTYDSTSFIPDSASTATSIASGYKTLSGVLNMDVTKQIAFKPISESLAEKGYKIGIISSVPINHATPAAFYAKVPSRNAYYDIGLQLADSGFDYFGGGDFLSPNDKDGKQTHIYNILKQKGYRIVNDKTEILKLSNKDKKVVAITPKPSVDGASLPYEIDRKSGELSLADYVKKGIDVLDNPNGFFMMAESGKIDWAGHANDSAASIHETIAFSDAVQVAVDFYKKHPKDTLILVTGDHECGGMSIGFAGTGYSTFFDKIEKVKMSATDGFESVVVKPYRESKTSSNAKLSDLQKEIKDNFGLLFPGDLDGEKCPEMVLSKSELKRLEDALKQTMIPREKRNYTDQEKIMYGSYDPLSVTLSHIVNNKAGIEYTSYSHTGLPVPVFVIGAGNELFNGFYDNTDIYNKMAEILKIK